MRGFFRLLIGAMVFVSWEPMLAHAADFSINSAIIEFNKDGPRQQDVIISSHSSDSNYIITEINEVINPGRPDETRHLITDPAQSGLLVVPDKVVLAPGGEKVLRFVLLHEPDAQEHIYRVAIKPIVKGIDDSNRLGLKILIGYEVLVIVRPAASVPSYQAGRQGNNFSVINNGNTDILFQNGQQCLAPGNCKPSRLMRVYPGTSAQVTLPLNAPVTYSVWDGARTIEKRFD